MPFQKGNKEFLKRKTCSGENHPMFGKHHSLETKNKISKAHMGMKKPWASEQMKLLKGPLAYNWQGGITPINKQIRQSLEYRAWRKAVFQRDNYTCIWCKARNGNGKTIILHADHIKPFAFYPELRFTVNNGRTLCITCHRKTFKEIWKK